MHKIDQIKILEIETTNTCNASCPQCLRTSEQDLTNVAYNDVLDFDKIVNNIDPVFWRNLDSINFNGNTGDNIAHPNIKHIVLAVAKLAPQATITVSTNGSLRNAKWWADFGLAFSTIKGSVTFGIDGLADTHSLYRVGTNYDRVIENALAFIGAGGKANWQMIPFEHNQHQIADCKQLSVDLGFENFILRHENRFPLNQTQQPVYFKGKQTHTIKASTVELSDSICQSFGAIDPSSKVKCKSIQINWMAIYADATVWPCCFLMGWHRSSHQSRAYQTINYHFKKVLGLDFSVLNLYNNKLEDILNGDVWQKRYPDSFDRMPNPVCLQQCSL